MNTNANSKTKYILELAALLAVMLLIGQLKILSLGLIWRVV